MIIYIIYKLALECKKLFSKVEHIKLLTAYCINCIILINTVGGRRCLMLDIDLTSRLPIYEQIIENIKTEIIKGVLQKDDRIPSVRILAQELTINPNTIQKAYRELERQGFIYSLPGKGSFVNEVKGQMNQERVAILKEEIVERVEELVFLEVPVSEIKTLLKGHSEEEKDEGRC